MSESCASNAFPNAEGEKQEAEVLSTPPQAYKVFNFLPTILSTPPQAYGMYSIC
jgi:hypothetical protein